MRLSTMITIGEDNNDNDQNHDADNNHDGEASLVFVILSLNINDKI